MISATAWRTSAPASAGRGRTPPGRPVTPAEVDAGEEHGPMLPAPVRSFPASGRPGAPYGDGDAAVGHHRAMPSRAELSSLTSVPRRADRPGHRPGRSGRRRGPRRAGDRAVRGRAVAPGALCAASAGRRRRRPLSATGAAGATEAASTASRPRRGRARGRAVPAAAAQRRLPGRHHRAVATVGRLGHRHRHQVGGVGPGRQLAVAPGLVARQDLDLGPGQQGLESVVARPRCGSPRRPPRPARPARSR